MIMYLISIYIQYKLAFQKPHTIYVQSFVRENCSINYQENKFMLFIANEYNNNYVYDIQ